MQISLATIRSKWALLTQLASIAVSASSAFLLQAPGLEIDDRTAEGIAFFSTAILSSLFLTFARRRTKTERARLRAIVSLSLVTLLVSFAVYRHLIAEWAEQPQESPRPIVTGNNLTDDAKQFVQEHGWNETKLSANEKRRLISGQAYRTRDVWKDGFLDRWSILTSLYTAQLVCVSVCVIGAVSLSRNRSFR